MCDLKISVLSMSVAKILSDVNSVQMIFDLTNSDLERTNASSWLDSENEIHFPLYNSVDCNSVTNARGIFNFHSCYVEKLRTFRSSEVSMKYSTFMT